MNFKQFEFTTVDEGLENLKKAVKLRNSMGGALYWIILNDDCIEITSQLMSMGVEQGVLSGILGG